MNYFDTSFLTPLVRKERTSAQIARFVAGLPTGHLAISRWTEVEFASLLARDVRMGAMNAAEARATETLFEEVVTQSLIVWLPEAEDYDLAKRYLRRHETGLRAGDALHLAIAANHDARAIHSLDKTMIKAGRLLGLPISGSPGAA
ncbi:type II toxin-antitoxin system VapC family toxin [Reyranella sp.]|uniref:type II toxin-antitoxin system VapC family toxin n=1 Tax=Reyranella sp. TaxID=1929291 RepID=UPI003782F167